MDRMGVGMINHIKGRFLSCLPLPLEVQCGLFVLGSIKAIMMISTDRMMMLMIYGYAQISKLELYVSESEQKDYAMTERLISGRMRWNCHTPQM